MIEYLSGLITAGLKMNWRDYSCICLDNNLRPLKQGDYCDTSSVISESQASWESETMLLSAVSSICLAALCTKPIRTQDFSSFWLSIDNGGLIHL